MKLEEFCFRALGGLTKLKEHGIHCCEWLGLTQCLQPCQLKGCTTEQLLLRKRVKIIASSQVITAGDRKKICPTFTAGDWCGTPILTLSSPSKILGTLNKCPQEGQNAKALI